MSSVTRWHPAVRKRVGACSSGYLLPDVRDKKMDNKNFKGKKKINSEGVMDCFTLLEK